MPLSAIDPMPPMRLHPLPNVWLGTSVENSAYLHRIDTLRTVSAHIRFVSFEPLLGPVVPVNLSGIQWSIVGGESGPGARPLESQWVEGIHAACQRQGVAFFFKQWGGTRKAKTGRTFLGRTWDEYPISAPQSDLPQLCEPRAEDAEVWS